AGARLVLHSMSTGRSLVWTGPASQDAAAVSGGAAAGTLLSHCWRRGAADDGTVSEAMARVAAASPSPMTHSSEHSIQFADALRWSGPGARSLASVRGVNNTTSPV